MESPQGTLSELLGFVAIVAIVWTYLAVGARLHELRDPHRPSQLDAFLAGTAMLWDYVRAPRGHGKTVEEWLTQTPEGRACLMKWTSRRHNDPRIISASRRPVPDDPGAVFIDYTAGQLYRHNGLGWEEVGRGR